MPSDRPATIADRSQPVPATGISQGSPAPRVETRNGNATRAPKTSHQPGGFFVTTSPRLRKRCSYGGCRNLVAPSARYCEFHQHIKNQTYGSRHQKTRHAIFENNGWRCRYCGQPVNSSDDIVHLAPTQTMSPAQSWSAAKVPAHRNCHNRHAPHLTQQNFHA